jgi:hypothetical protein
MDDVGVATTGAETMGCDSELSGAPTAISQRWPGLPCSGLSWEFDDADTTDSCMGTFGDEAATPAFSIGEVPPGNRTESCEPHALKAMKRTQNMPIDDFMLTV